MKYKQLTATDVSKEQLMQQVRQLKKDGKEILCCISTDEAGCHVGMTVEGQFLTFEALANEAVIVIKEDDEPKEELKRIIS